MVHLDYIQSYLPASVNAKVVGLLDSPLWLDIDPISDKYVGLQRTTQVIPLRPNHGKQDNTTPRNK